MSGLVHEIPAVMPLPSGRAGYIMVIISPSATAEVSKGLSEVLLLVDQLIGVKR